MKNRFNVPALLYLLHLCSNSLATDAKKDSLVALAKAVRSNDEPQVTERLSKLPSLSDIDAYVLLWKSQDSLVCRDSIVKAILQKNPEPFDDLATEVVKQNKSKPSVVEIKNPDATIQNILDFEKDDQFFGSIPINIEHPGHFLLFKAASGLCPGALQLLGEKSDGPAFLFAAAIEDEENKLSTSSFISVFRSGFPGENLTEDSLSRWSTVFQMIAEKVKAECATTSIHIEFCKRAQKAMLAEAERVIALGEEQEKALAYQNSPQAVKDAACEVSRKMQTAEQNITQEKEIAKVGGYQNSVKVYAASKIIVDGKRELATLRSEYKKRSKKALTLKDCEVADEN